MTKQNPDLFGKGLEEPTAEERANLAGESEYRKVQREKLIEEDSEVKKEWVDQNGARGVGADDSKSH